VTVDDMSRCSSYRLESQVFHARLGAGEPERAETQTPVASRCASSRDGRACIEHTC
jgi:hypothetical protein